MDKHYKTKLNSSFISNALPKTFIECLKKEKCYRSFIKYMLSHCDYKRTEKALVLNQYKNDYDTVNRFLIQMRNNGLDLKYLVKIQDIYTSYLITSNSSRIYKIYSNRGDYQPLNDVYFSRYDRVSFLEQYEKVKNFLNNKNS